MVVFLEDSPISTEELWSSVRVTIRFLVTSLTKDLLPCLLSLARQPALGSVLVVPNLFHLRMTVNTVLGDLQCCRHFLVPFPRSVTRHNPVSELYRQIHRPHDLVFALTCTVNCGTLYRQVWVFPNHVQSSRLQSSCRAILRMITGNAPELNFKSHSKGSEYLCKWGISVFYVE